MSHQLTFDWNAIERTAQSLDDAARDMTGVLEDLDQQVSVLRGQWTGAAQQAYDDAQQKWAEAMRELVTLAADASRVAGDAASRYASAERSNTQRWSIG
ncbi:MAG: WXG100 family type VII secretion target [Cellulomonadaceae bacterium]|nr:WXG100 family type VII secretion target [Cellulomonadaceae bacterium]